MADISSSGSKTILDAAQNYEITELINRGLAYAVIVAGFLSVVFIFYGGISFILSGGDEEKTKAAVGTIRYAIVGLIITIFATVIVGIIGEGMGINVIEYINLGDIIDFVREITTQGSSGVRSLN